MCEATGFWSKLFKFMLPLFMLGKSDKKDLKHAEKAS